MRVYINEFAYFTSPLMLTLIIPLFMIKEGEKYGYPENEGLREEKISLKESLRLTFKNKVFMRWQAVNCCTFFGLQMFLVSMNALILGGMGMNGAEMAILNTCAFGPVPVMLYLFNKLKAKKGIRFTYQTCLLSFAVAILSFFFGSTFLVGTGNKALQYAIGITGGICGSWAIGAFFMMPYHITAQVSSVEEKLTGKNHSAMYFAGNAVCSSIVSAISGSLIYETVKNLFICKGMPGIVFATSQVIDGEVVNAINVAANAFGANPSQVFNLGTLLVPFIVAACCVLGAILAMKMPKDYTPELVGKQLKELDPSIDLSVIETDERYQVQEEKGEILFVQIGLSILSGFIFGFIWTAFLFKSIKELAKKGKTPLKWLLSCLLPFGGIFTTLSAYKTLQEKYGEKLTQNPVGGKILLILSGIFLPILPLNLVALCFMQSKINRAYALDAQAAKEAV